MKKFVIVLASLLIVTGCVSGDELTRTVPRDCEIAKVVEAFDQQVAGSKFVPTDWEPMEGTDLKAVYDAGGIACSYGIQVAEVGGTVLWAPASDSLWAERSEIWQGDGMTAIDLAGVDEQAAFILQEGTSADEMHVWKINLLVDGIWIQVGATFLQTVDEAAGIIEAAVEATEG